MILYWGQNKVMGNMYVPLFFLLFETYGSVNLMNAFVFIESNTFILMLDVVGVLKF